MRSMWLCGVVALAACGDDGVHHLADAPPSACNTADCTAVGASFSGLSWVLPCGQMVDQYDCVATEAHATGTVSGGVAGTTYQVTLRFRGVVEQKTYNGGTKDGYWQVGGTPSTTDGYNIYALVISRPAQTFYLNAGMSMIGRTWAMDYTQSVQVDDGATLMLEADPLDGYEILNIDDQFQPVTAPEATIVTQPYNGQFIQLDVVEVAPLGT